MQKTHFQINSSYMNINQKFISKLMQNNFIVLQERKENQQ